jgi:uncharacterized phage protein (TIGR02220 family)
MAKKDPAMLFYPDDFLSGTILMNYEQKGKYITLICLHHSKGYLTEDEITAVLGVEKIEDADKRILSKFKKDNDSGFYYNERAKKEREKRIAYSESRRENRIKTFNVDKKDKHMLNISQTYEKHMGNRNIYINNNDIDINNNTNNKENLLNNICKNIIDYLNEKTNKKFKPVESNLKFIRGRLNDGYTEEDLKRVVDIQVKEWLGGDMEKYLRPETLFNATKFQTYVNKKYKQTQVCLGK